MKYINLLIFTILLVSTSCENSGVSNEKTYTFTPDTLSLIRNPCMGWGLYDDASNEVQKANEYWDAQDEAAKNYASFFYVRWRWSDMEPEEGKYAWLYDENYKKLIQGALDRGLKLCFRVYNHGQDNVKQSTPDFVRKAGAKGFYTSCQYKHWTPYIDDSIFQEKLNNFITAFAKEYDNSEIVDFVDGVNVGFWGECHGLELKNNTSSSRENFFEWITSVYSNNFKKVILLLPFGSNFGFDLEKSVAIDNKGYGMRRDGLGSMWFSDEEIKIANSMYGKCLLVGESCWWGASADRYKSDTKYKLTNWRDVYELTSDQAINFHFNTLDLREQFETKGWTEIAKDKVELFIKKGGYRIYPTSISAPEKIKAGNEITIKHTWKNIATGYLPNNNIKWNYKYKVSFALIDKNNKIVELWIDNKAEPSTWLYNIEKQYVISHKLPAELKGDYKLAVSIFNTQTEKAGIKLALNTPIINGWNYVGDVYIR